MTLARAVCGATSKEHARTAAERRETNCFILHAPGCGIRQSHYHRYSFEKSVLLSHFWKRIIVLSLGFASLRELGRCLYERPRSCLIDSRRWAGSNRAFSWPAAAMRACISLRELARGNGVSGTGTPRKLHSGSQPCETSYTSNRLAG